jgi:KTSC domain
MIRQSVVSSDLKSVGYDEASSLLELEFQKGGNVYQYSGVPEAVYFELISASSKGRYFNTYIKNRYHCQRVD